MKTILIMKSMLFSILITIISTKKCLFPKGAKDFEISSYEGTWYEIAKFQTAGGAFWEKDCVCTTLNPVLENNKILVHNICRNKTPQGKVTDAVGELIDEDSSNPGHYKQRMFWFTPAIDYTIVLQGKYKGEDYSVEYDCNKSFFFGRNYCVHFLSRNAHLSEETLNFLIEMVNEMGLNSDNLPLVKTKHEGCW